MFGGDVDEGTSISMSRLQGHFDGVANRNCWLPKRRHRRGAATSVESDGIAEEIRYALTLNLILALLLLAFSGLAFSRHYVLW